MPGLHAAGLRCLHRHDLDTLLIHNCIGKGSFGAVYRGILRSNLHERSAELAVATKVIPLLVAADAAGAQREASLQHEAGAHPSVVTVMGRASNLSPNTGPNLSPNVNPSPSPSPSPNSNPNPNPNQVMASFHHEGCAWLLLELCSTSVHDVLRQQEAPLTLALTRTPALTPALAPALTPALAPALTPTRRRRSPSPRSPRCVRGCSAV